jgi:hypothetical protein
VPTAAFLVTDSLGCMQNAFYAQCLLPARAQANVAAGWDGSIAMPCDGMPDLHASKQPDPGCPSEGCAMTYDACFGAGAAVDLTESMQCCQEGVSCVVKNYRYAQCLPDERAATNVAAGWDGRVLSCEAMPADLMPELSAGAPMASRKMLSQPQMEMPSRQLTQV